MCTSVYTNSRQSTKSGLLYTPILNNQLNQDQKSNQEQFNNKATSIHIVKESERERTKHYLCLPGSSLGGPFSCYITALLLEVHLEIHNNAFALQIPNLNAGLSRSTQPIPVRAEAEGVDNRASIQRVELLPLGQIPEQNHTIFPTTGAQRAVGGDSRRVDVARVASQSRPELTIAQVPDLNGPVPGAGHDGRLKGVGREPHAGDPVGVSVLILDGVLALAKGVPELDGLVAGGGHDLAVVNREGDGEDVLGVADEATGGDAGLEVPEAELSVPGSGEGKLAVGGEDDVLDEVGVAVHAAAGDAEVAVFLGEGPEDDGFVAGGGDDHVGVVDGGGDGGDPIGVGAHGAAEDELFLRHWWIWEWRRLRVCLGRVAEDAASEEALNGVDENIYKGIGDLLGFWRPIT
ncbi:ribosomal RNA small subunit methyltransferase H [Striga asiatica]|uniref:Ribosomal RNA small subunit methyltransferase H n=1 Tax=Striga asiatica TaxID=4170 RepID=A0A5A7PHP4_STRAF|nr:ribosomal RNA small subunit methyltransferase H [Striga asiatica]